MDTKISYGIALVIALAIITVFTVLGSKEKKRRFMFGWIGIVLIVVSLIGAFTVPALGTTIQIGGPASPLAGGVQTTKTCPDGSVILVTQTCPSGGTTICAVEDTTVTLSAQDKYTSVASGGNHRYRIDGSPAKTVADAGTLTASPTDIMNLLWVNESKTGYFASPQVVTVTCKGTETFSTLVSKNGTLSIKVLDQDAGDLISDSNAETLAAGDVVDLKMTLQGDYKNDFPYGFVAVIELNKTAMDSVILLKDGIELQKASVPQADAPSLAGASTQRLAYIVPEVISNKEYTYTVHLDADDAVNPESASGNVTVKFYPRTYYIDDKNGGIYAGPAAEDEENVVTRTGQFTYNLYTD